MFPKPISLIAETKLPPPLNQESEWRSSHGLTLREALKGAVRHLEFQEAWKNACDAAEFLGGDAFDFFPKAEL